MKKIIVLISVLLMCITLCGCVQKENRILIVKFISDQSEEITDKTMIENALENGGMVFVGTSAEEIEELFGNAYKNYGAVNAEGRFYTVGALLNYICSLGWHLDEAPSSSLENIYYFSR